MKNMVQALKKNRILLIHTESIACGHHAYPRDYFRFMKDWWKDIQKEFKIKLLELYIKKNNHIFVCYRKIK
jgi:hypothetical protein